MRTKTIHLLILLLGTALTQSAFAQADRVKLTLKGRTLRGPATGMALSGDYVYVTGRDGLEVFDISDPANPRRVSRYGTTGLAMAVAVSGRHAYVAASGLEVIDLIDPSNPRQVGLFSMSRSFDVVVAGAYAYVISDQTEDIVRDLNVLDISNPSNPQQVGVLTDETGGLLWLSVGGTHAFLAKRRCDGGVVDVLDLSNPSIPQRIGKMDTVGWPSGLVVSGNYAYLVDDGFDCKHLTGPEGLVIFDIRDPVNPKRLGSHPVIDDETGVVNTLDLAISGNYAFVIGNREWLQVFDVSNPTNPKRVGGFKTAQEDFAEFSGIAVSGRYAYLTSGDSLRILEITELPAITRTKQTSAGLFVQWNEPAKGMKLQRATILAQPDWEDISGSENTSSLTVPFGASSAFFRLVKPSP